MTTDKFLEGALLVLIGALCAVVFVRIKWGRERRKAQRRTELRIKWGTERRKAQRRTEQGSLPDAWLRAWNRRSGEERRGR